MGVDLNDFIIKGFFKRFFVKPKASESESIKVLVDFKDQLRALPTDENRVAFINQALKDVCRPCGQILKPSEVCHCENDD